MLQTPDKSKDPLRILLVEDDPMQRYLIQHFLAEPDYKVFTTSTAEEGLKLLSLQRIDFVLMDVHLPGMNGFEAVRQIRTLDAHHWRPIMMVTSNDTAEDWENATRYGADDYLVKPLEKHKLLNKIHILHRLYLAYHRQQEDKKIQALGHFAAGVAHDFNNITATISGYAEMLQEELNPESFSYQCSQEIIQSVKKARNLINSLLLYVREEPIDFQPLQASLLIEKVAQTARIKARDKVNIKVNIEEAAYSTFIQADATQIERVLDNLVVNALDAMPKGQLTLGLRLCKSTHADGSRQLAISVEDQGEGISPEHLRNIFDPFFTTKDIGQGSGLGLSIVKGIIEAHRGNINVSSHVGLGTLFTIFLPIME
ncbi:Signal transduction histidine kinase [Allopseudospirillum japonicum]|uniref:histidine kinase n=1 Tax=Allopseudospirillum japonicum TaxID=64971 RepID=A0A1H6S705_9GAMM|nr:hybrid sensor histidine kinase/response regulator [Allopseudospirillum japonicum]SEI63833.1 Signal transduction histidine kinase [Allopseudospirillum japonicum]